MKQNLIEKFISSGAVKNLVNKVESAEEKYIGISSLQGSSLSLLMKSLFDVETSLLALKKGKQAVNEFRVELYELGLEKHIVMIDDVNDENIQDKLTEIRNKEKSIVIADYKLLQLKLPSKDAIESNTTSIQLGEETSYDDLIEYLGLINYQREKYVDSPGDFAIRGSIIDFWSYSEKLPCRLEFDGDFIESIRYFDSESQRSLNKVEKVTLASSVNREESDDYSNIFDYLNQPTVIASRYELKEIIEKKNNIENRDKGSELPEDIKHIVNEDEEKNNDRIEYISVEDLFNENAKWIVEEEIQETDNRINLGIKSAPAINANFELLFNSLLKYCGSGYDVIITSENDFQAKRLVDLLSEYKEEFAKLLEEKKIAIEILAIKAGFVIPDEKLLVLSDYQIFNKPYRTKISKKRKVKKSRAREFASLKRGDYVVHENFGIGQYNGLETIQIGSIEQESIKILYAEGGVVYVNLNYLSLVKKFSSNEDAQPRLSVLGSNEWKNTKKRVKSKIKEAARDLIQLYAKRKAAVGITYSPDSIWQKELEASFQYEDTPDQAKVTEDVKSDMESSNPMDRLVCGDVGFGKTEIAVRAAFKAINDGKQVAMLAPTTILTEQHFNTFRDRLSQFPVKVASLSRFQTKTKQTEIIMEMERGNIDVVVGTHRLISKDVKFKDLGLLIIDEEHRFGVMAKEKLRSLKANIDTLTLTATPIPRTLNLSLLGARDLSIIGTPPLNRQPIYTKVENLILLK